MSVADFGRQKQSDEEVCTSINAALNYQAFGPSGTRNMPSLSTSLENDVVDNLLVQWTTLTVHPFHPRKKSKS